MTETKEMVVVKEQVEKCLLVVKDITITNQKEYDDAVVVGKKVASLVKFIDDKEKAITRPINDSLKQIRDLFRPYKTQAENAKASIKNMMDAFMRAEDAKRKVEEAKIVARVEKGTMREDTAATKLANIEVAAPVTTGNTTSVLVIKSIDLKQVPEKYLILNEALVKADHRAGIDIAGVTLEYETRSKL